MYQNTRDFSVWLAVKYGLDNVRHDGLPSQTQRFLTMIQEYRSIDAVSDLAGYFGPKIIEYRNQRILVPHHPHLIEGAEGDYPVINQLLAGLFPGEQDFHFRLWLATSLGDLYAQKLTLGLAVALCGPVSAGKSLLQHLLTQLFGGRAARPFSVLSKQTHFNAHLFDAEHLMFEDESSPDDLKARTQLGMAIKAAVANLEAESEGKYQQTVLVPPRFQRLTISTNHIEILPPKDHGLDDKLSLYQCESCPMPMPTSTHEEKQAFWSSLMAELPAFIFDLLYKTPIPDIWKSDRFGIKPFRHQKVVEELDKYQAEELLRQLIWRHYFVAPDAVKPLHPLELSATDVLIDLQASDDQGIRTLANNLLRNPIRCGIYLSRLAVKFPLEFQKCTRNEERIYRIMIKS
jgi:hypothetical protein